MNKEQIEEMAVIGCVRNPQAHSAEECAKCDFKNGQCNSYRHAEVLYNAGYRKVPDGAVILTPEERDEELKACNEKQAELEAEIEILKIQNNNLEIAFDRLNARSERFESNMKSVFEIEKRKAVEEFAKKVKEYINNKVIADFDDSESVQYYTIDLDEFECEIDEILKELTE